MKYLLVCLLSLFIGTVTFADTPKVQPKTVSKAVVTVPVKVEKKVEKKAVKTEKKVGQCHKGHAKIGHKGHGQCHKGHKHERSR